MIAIAKISPAMRAILSNLEAGRRPLAHLHGASQMGGSTGTVRALLKRGLIDDEFKITEVGRDALALARLGAGGR